MLNQSGGTKKKGSKNRSSHQDYEKDKSAREEALNRAEHAHELYIERLKYDVRNLNDIEDDFVISFIPKGVKLDNSRFVDDLSDSDSESDSDYESD